MAQTTTQRTPSAAAERLRTEARMLDRAARKPGEAPGEAQRLRDDAAERRRRADALDAGEG